MGIIRDKPSTGESPEKCWLTVACVPKGSGLPSLTVVHPEILSLVPEIELIKISRFIQSPIPLIAFIFSLLFILAGGFSPQLRNRFAYFKVFAGVAIVIVLVMAVAFAAPALLHDSTILGVVINPRTQAALAGVHVSVDGYPDLKYNTDTDGNFQITIPARRRQDSYTVRAQVNGVASAAKIEDAETSKKALDLLLDAPEASGSVTVNLLDGISLRNGITMLADEAGSTAVFGSSCSAEFLNTKVRGGILRAGSHAELMEQLSYRLVSPATSKISVTVNKDKGIYEIGCEK